MFAWWSILVKSWSLNNHELLMNLMLLYFYHILNIKSKVNIKSEKVKRQCSVTKSHSFNSWKKISHILSHDSQSFIYKISSHMKSHFSNNIFLISLVIAEWIKLFKHQWRVMKNDLKVNRFRFKSGKVNYLKLSPWNWYWTYKFKVMEQNLDYMSWLFITTALSPLVFHWLFFQWILHIFTNI